MAGRLSVIAILFLLVFVVPVGWFLGSPDGDQDFDPTGSVFSYFGAPLPFMVVMLAGAGTAIWLAPRISSHSTNLEKFSMIAGGIVVLPVGLFFGMWLGPTGWGIGEALLGPWARVPGSAVGMFGVPFVISFCGAMLGLGVVSVIKKITALVR